MYVCSCLLRDARPLLQDHISDLVSLLQLVLSSAFVKDETAAGLVQSVLHLLCMPMIDTDPVCLVCRLCSCTQVIEIGKSDMPAPVKALMRAPYVERMIAGIFQIFIMSPKDVGSYDLEQNQEALVY